MPKKWRAAYKDWREIEPPKKTCERKEGPLESALLGITLVELIEARNVRALRNSACPSPNKICRSFIAFVS